MAVLYKSCSLFTPLAHFGQFKHLAGTYCQKRDKHRVQGPKNSVHVAKAQHQCQKYVQQSGNNHTHGADNVEGVKIFHKKCRLVYCINNKVIGKNQTITVESLALLLFGQ